MTKRLSILRHGQTQTSGKFLGHTNDLLTPLGRQQMKLAMREQTDFDSIYSSPLGRCLEFAEEWAENQDLELTLMDELKELDFGSWTLKDKSSLSEDEKWQWRTDPQGLLPSDAENLQDFAQRVDDAWQTLLEELRHQEHILVVTHAGVLRQMLGNLLGIPLEKRFNYSVPHAFRVNISLKFNQTSYSAYINSFN